MWIPGWPTRPLSSEPGSTSCRLGRTDSVIGSADDVAQEVCLAAVAALRSYVVSGRSFRSFVYGIAANKVVDAFRAMGRNRTDPTADVPDGPVLDDGPVQRLLATQLAERLACGVPEPVTRH